MPITTLADMQIVPAKFTDYTIQRTTEKSELVKNGLCVGNAQVGALINGTPRGGNTIIMPHFNKLTGDDQVFGRKPLEANKITTGQEKATLLVREVMWGDADLATVFGGADPMSAIINQYADWRTGKEQGMLISTLKGISGKAIKDHVNDISKATGKSAIISVDATLDTKQLLGDAATSLGVVFMHSATYTYLQKQQQVINVFDPTDSTRVSFQTYLNFRIVVDDGLPVADGVYDTYFMGTGVFARQDGVPQGLVTTENDRDKKASENYLIQRFAMVLHPMGCSFLKDQDFKNSADKYADNADLEDPENWALATDHKNVHIAVMRHKIA